MSCNLIILGKNLDIDGLIRKSKLRGFTKIYKGQPALKSKPQGRKITHSQIGIQTSKAAFNDLKKQIKDTIRFLKKHKGNLKMIKETDEIDLAFLDFATDLRIDNKKVHFQSVRFPTELLQLAGDIGLELEISVYPMGKANLKKTTYIKQNSA
jgi:hypothetical protein